MKFKSTIFAQTSGSLAGKTFSHNKGGMYVRARATPTNPATAAQQNARNALKTLTTRWGAILNDTERAQWTLYAANVPLLNKLGEPHPIPPLAMYLRCNSPRLQAGNVSSIVDAGPFTYSLATLTTPSGQNTAGALTVNYTNTDDWATTTGGWLLVYLSKPQNPTINFFKGPFLYIGQVAGDTATPPTSPTNVGTPDPVLNTGNKYFVRFRASNADGRLSSDFITSFIA